MRYQNENFNGELDFRSNIHDGWKISAHLHEYSELLYCKRGVGKVIINGSEIHIKEKQLVWIPPNYIHEYRCESAEVVCAVFSNDMVPLFFKALNERYFCVSAVDMDELTSILDTIHHLTRDDYLTVSGYLNLICANVFKQSKFESRRPTDGILYQKVISYLSEHYTENITLSQLAKMFGYNEKYLSHSLHNLTGVNFRQLLTFYRIDHAKKLLENSNGGNISAVALESGFGALNSFNREFKKNVGITPSEYRKLFTL